MDFSVLLLPLGALPGFAAGFYLGFRRRTARAIDDGDSFLPASHSPARKTEEPIEHPPAHEWHIAGKKMGRVIEECHYCTRQRYVKEAEVG